MRILSLVYTFRFKLGAFIDQSCLILRRDMRPATAEEFHGSPFRNPWRFAMLAVSGWPARRDPPTARLHGKFWLFSAAIDAHY